MSQQRWIDEYARRGAYWRHDGNPKRPHACLTEGGHSSGFFNSKPIIAEDSLLEECAAELVDMMQIHGLNIAHVDCVIGPQTGATKLAEFISARIGTLRGHECAYFSPVKIGVGAEKQLAYTAAELLSMHGDRTLFCDDVGTTFSSMRKAADPVMDTVEILPFCTVLVNRSSPQQVAVQLGRTPRVFCEALITVEMPIWTPRECPLCKMGSEAIRPKEGDNWQRLTADY